MAEQFDALLQTYVSPPALPELQDGEVPPDPPAPPAPIARATLAPGVRETFSASEYAPPPPPAPAEAPPPPAPIASTVLLAEFQSLGTSHELAEPVGDTMNPRHRPPPISEPKPHVVANAF
jgi:hypothetical protein